MDKDEGDYGFGSSQDQRRFAILKIYLKPKDLV